MRSSSAAALKLSCSATAGKVRSWCSVRDLSRASGSAIADSRTTIGHVTEVGGGREPGPRARIDRLLDPGSFTELDGLAGAAAAGDPPVVAGAGAIDGRDVAVYAVDPTRLDEAVAPKALKIQDLAPRSRIPLLAILEPAAPPPQLRDPADRADRELQALAAPDCPRHAQEIVSRILDDGRFLGIRPRGASDVLIGLGRLGGHPAGVVANRQGPSVAPAGVDAATRAARFVR